MIKLVASDLDDTLLDQHSKLSQENRQVIAEAMAAGITFTLATGRMFQSAAPFLRELGGEPDLPMICYNGALIKRLSGETLYEESLSPEISSLIVGFGQERGWTVNAYFDDELYVSAMDRYVEDYQRTAQVEVTIVDDLVEFIQVDQKRLNKLLIIGEPEETPGRLAELQTLVGSQVQMVRSRKKFIEVTNLKAHKGQALLWLADFLGLQVAEVMAIGDSNNDVTMLQMAGIGVAVANASQRVQAAADALTVTNDEHGVAQAIRRFAFGDKV